MRPKGQNHPSKHRNSVHCMALEQVKDFIVPTVFFNCTFIFYCIFKFYNFCSLMVNHTTLSQKRNK